MLAEEHGTSADVMSSRRLIQFEEERTDRNHVGSRGRGLKLKAMCAGIFSLGEFSPVNFKQWGIVALKKVYRCKAIKSLMLRSILLRNGPSISGF